MDSIRGVLLSYRWPDVMNPEDIEIVSIASLSFSENELEKIIRALQVDRNFFSKNEMLEYLANHGVLLEYIGHDLSELTEQERENTISVYRD